MPTRALDRRTFLSAAAGAIVAPTILPRLHAQEAKRRKKKLNIAAIGVGGRGSLIAAQAAQLGNLVACCDVVRSNAKGFQRKMAEQNIHCRRYGDYRELLDQESDIDAVVIGTPDHWHVKIAVDAMQAGKHVYCEKPLTLTLEEGVLVKRAVDKHGKIFQVGTQQRSEYDLCFLKAVAIARSGRLGSKLSAISSVGKAASRSQDADLPWGPFRVEDAPRDMDWDLWLGQAPKVPYCRERHGWNFRWWFEYSGGQVTDWGVHHTDIAFWALAGKHGQAVEASGTGEFMGVPREQVRDYLLGKIDARDMPPAYNTAHAFDVDVRLSTGNTIKIVSGPNELLLSGEDGRIRVNRGGLTGKPVEEVDADPKAKQEIEELMASLYGGELPNKELGHMRNFFDCVENGRQPVANVHEHVRAVNACHLANIALVTGRTVKFDPDACAFPGDEEATRLTYRPRRSQFHVSV